jgi:hypothetical protein
MTKNTALLRSVLVLLAMGLAAPALAQTARRAPPPSSYQTLRIGPLIGLEFADGDAGLALRGDASVPLSRMSPTVSLDGVLSVGLSWFDDEDRRFDVDVSTTIFKVIPALRLTAPLSPTVGLYGDVGMGFYYGSTDFDDGDGFFGDADVDDSGFGIGMRFAGGLFADVSPSVRLGTEIGVNPYFGEYDETTLSWLFSAMFRL